MNEYVVIYKQSCGAKYSCLTITAKNGYEAKEYALTAYGYIINEDTFVKVVKII